MHLTILLVLIAAAVYGYPTQESQTPPGDVSKPGRSGKDLWKLQRILLRAIHSDSRPSRDSVYQWFNPNAGLNSAAIAGMQITASIPSVNLDNIPGVSSITCNDDKVTMVVSSIAELADWELQKILLLIDYRHKCQKGDEAKFVMLVATSWMIDTTTNTVVFDTKDPQAEGVTGSYVIVANPGTDLPEPVNPTSQVTSLEKRGGANKNKVSPTIFDKTMTVPLVLEASTKRNVLFGSVGSGNTLTLGCNPCSIRVKQHSSSRHKASSSIPLRSLLLKLVASARAALTAAISVDLELLAKMPKFFTKLSASEKVAQYPIEPEYSVSASATALVSGETKFTIGPQLALNVGVFGLDIPKTSIEMEVASYMDFSVKGKLQKKIISNGEKGEIATLTALANIGIRAGVSANLFGACFSLYISPILKVFTKEYKTLMFDEPPAEVVSIESAVKLSAQAIKHAIEHPLIGANPQIAEQSTVPETKRPFIEMHTQV
ncbi:hypothetical protein BASA50_005555 [Batrachochytrium salamandrivorans]|uniref:Lipid-binding serum glycoprotein C-terminal domain-containing protein n=1 Tax=Batrachochytrium salamandrivorans TaxID=1357716 RepID=A0ABQ8FCT1_9FUNG|nr:hypothetical protein BASA50_005555 [Batrachochytrium salamandrivorans]